MPIKSSFGAAASRSFKNIVKVYDSFSDDFNRGPDYSGSFGISSSGKLWTFVKGVWYGFSGYTSSGFVNQKDMATVEMSSPNVTLATSSREIENSFASNVTGTISGITVGDGTNYSVGYSLGQLVIAGPNNPSVSNIPIGSWISATPGTGYLYSGTPTQVEVIEIVNTTTLLYRVKGGNPPSGGTVTNLKYTIKYDNGLGAAVWTTDSDNWIGVVNGIKATSCNCSLCGNGSYSCTGYVTNYSCTGYGSYTSPTYCVSYTSYSYPNYIRAVTGFYRIGSYTRFYACNIYGGGGTYSGCTSSSSYPSCSSSIQNVSSCNCQTCYPSYIAVVKSVSGAVTELARYSLSATSRAFKVITNSISKTLTIRAYSDQARTAQIGSDMVYTDATMVPKNQFGIIILPLDSDTITYQRPGEFNDFQVDTN